MSTLITHEFPPTVIGDWYQRLAANKSPRRNHWQTKIVYYRAVTELLASRPGAPLTWKSVVGAARPYGCRSTFYEVAGARARHRMVDDLIADGRVDAIQLALRYLRTDPVEQLIDEAKVWSYWPYRQRLLATLSAASAPAMAGFAGAPATVGFAGAPATVALAAVPATVTAAEEELIRAVRAWAGRNQALAAATGYSPPACAVEDLTQLHQGRIAALRACSLLSDVIRQAA